MSDPRTVDRARELVEVIGALLVPTRDGGVAFRDGWQPRLSTFLGEALLEDPGWLESAPEGLEAVAASLAGAEGGQAASRELVTFAGDLARRFEKHLYGASVGADRERKAGGALIGAAKARLPDRQAPAGSLKASPFARFVLAQAK
jgi:hypothetical protein